MRPRVPAVVLALATAVFLQIWCLPADSRAAGSSTPSPFEASSDLTRMMLDSYATRSNATDTRYWGNGRFSSDAGCWACVQGGPATAAAQLWLNTGRRDDQLWQMATQTFDNAIATGERPGGGVAGPNETGGPEVSTMFFGVELGTTLMQLRSFLDVKRRTAWADALVRMSDYLIANKNVTWYTNGNINLGNAELFYLTWKATGAQRFLAAYESALNFALNPPQDTWPGRGLHYTRVPTQADGSDGAGYLAETGPGGTGFDPEYTELQLTVATRLWLVSGDARILRLCNLLANQLWSRIDSIGDLDTSGGTRHVEAGRKVPFNSTGITILATLAGRSDFAGLVPVQLTRMRKSYLDAAPAGDPYYYRGFGNEVSLLGLAHDVVGSARAGAPQATSLGEDSSLVLEASPSRAHALAASTSREAACAARIHVRRLVRHAILHGRLSSGCKLGRTTMTLRRNGVLIQRFAVRGGSRSVASFEVALNRRVLGGVARRSSVRIASSAGVGSSSLRLRLMAP